MGVLDALGQMGGNLGSSVEGMIFDGAGVKGVLFIPNPNYFDPTDPDLADLQKDLNAATKELQKELDKTVKGKLSLSGLKSLAPKGMGLDGKSLGIGKEAEENKKFIKYKLQYNPATIRLDTLNGQIQNMNGQDDMSKLVQTKKFQGRTKLSFDIVFDDVDIMDSFMLEDVANFNVTKGVKKAYHMLNKEDKGNTFSVSARMEAFLALLSASSAQQVIFFWSKMSFRGLITSVSNKYTMFNTAGNPVRGTMHLEITQDNENKEAFEYSEEYWRKSFDNIFKAEKGFKGASAASKVFNNNFLNIKL